MPMFDKVGKVVRLRFGLPFARRADRARDRGEWIEAVVDYRRAVEWMPWRQDLYVQIGNCLKEFGDYQGAIRSYSTVSRGPSLSEASKQAADANRRAGTIFPPFAISEGGGPEGRAQPPRALPELTDRSLPNRIRFDTPGSREWLGSLGQDNHVSSRLRGASYASVKFDQIGSMVLSRDGSQEPLLAGVVAIRGRISGFGALTHAEMTIGEGDAVIRDSIPLHPVPGVGPLRLYVFNHWIDCSKLPRGRHWLSVGAGARITPSGVFVNIVVGPDNDKFETSNSYVAVPGDYGADLDAAVIALPTPVRPAGRTLFDRTITSILALRVDQLGDVSASLAGLARLRGMFPNARLTVLVQAAVRAMIVASGLADEILTIELSYDPGSGRRSLPAPEETRLRAQLAPRAFDLAIDLSPGDESRPLLLLTGATYLVGFNPDRFTFLDFGIAARSRDKINQLEKLSHGAAVMMLVESLAVATTSSRPIVPRTATGDLEATGLRAREYVVLHLGARHPINRWPAGHFGQLCARVIAETPYDVVIFADGAVEQLPRDAGSRLRVFDIVDPERFDTIVSNAAALVGNDSGPKHLAAARGVPTVSIHVDRLNWNEWGQDGAGTILSKRMPCTGCGLNNIDLCGRDAVCVRSITVDEVFAALKAYL